MNFYSLLPSRHDVSADNITEKFCQFCLCCNPWYAGADTRQLANAFNMIPKSEGQKFEIWVLFLLVRQYHQKIINSWSKLVGFLGVERKDEQSTQKIQQYVVRLKRWMSQTHVDAFFDYLLNKPNPYYLEIPETQPQVRCNVNVTDDLVIKSLRAGLMSHPDVNSSSISTMRTSTSPSNWIHSASASLDDNTHNLGSFVTNPHADSQECPTPQSLLMRASHHMSERGSQQAHQTTPQNHSLPHPPNMFEPPDEDHQLPSAANNSHNHDHAFQTAEAVGVADSIDPDWHQWPDDLRDVSSPKESDGLNDSWSRQTNQVETENVENEAGVPRKRGRPPGARNKIKRLRSEPSVSLTLSISWYERFEKLMHAQNTMLRSAFSHVARLPMETVSQLLSHYTETISQYLPPSETSPIPKTPNFKFISSTLLALVSSHSEILEASTDRLIWTVHQGPLTATICHAFNLEKAPSMHSLAEAQMIPDVPISHSNSMEPLDTVSSLKLEIAKLNAALKEKNLELENLKRKIMNAVFD
ncbi:ARS binding protein Abp2 [Schizosaccharomyces pombe]|uniref:ARS-binding protein 2 n=1 Tax=Schizosaccharomyces pombe (strain 972 / ATCC 24843) TaxID=284812 RepID=ABP2_SCHPO|nr:ARS-binding protein Abp2 [Schizosaccharomyces pombe]Q9USY4.1 RecName: Full=ARS-binding protein 2 [Schizosaccharomyces pombe 972h-]CAB52738.1 ARS binding protein Abp2 [Schizosaccharomyces pombe]|eukprot:NP_596719.1 ARS-binding protein Abp2 [Schizosaccharomyces pombe]